MDRHHELGTADEFMGGPVGGGFYELRSETVTGAGPRTHQIAVGVPGSPASGFDWMTVLSVWKVRVVWVWRSGHVNQPSANECRRRDWTEAAEEV